ncbi:Ni/Fe hydrogenase subunit alpha [Glycomyces harbinensis]|uniref:Coenzyme F420-reducing hydrogenase, alpha subunit n=1 Tax=Glycomyces harbinensis TaxID=58114 RepID=A0A1G6XPC3_9ACTN|nr:Ni/Fe hydrogenase subunit alpha [Glycomyces harbinensis]SDD79217.1 Coenzyme F420-reducing hydrogenase, alpha subunit [Glycomyces harbinensis]
MTHKGSGDRLVAVDELARVEGEGALRLRVSDGAVVEAELNIYEPPRYFESFLVGRNYSEPPDITARICGICPVAYQMSSCQAIEDACGVQVPEPIWALRRLLYCGEWIESHALHIYLLHAPDFLGLPDAIELAKIDRALVEAGLALKKAGNELMEIIGGRAIHPVNVRLGGFYRLPTPDELQHLRQLLEPALDQALRTVEWTSTLEFPDYECEHELLAMSAPGTYPIERGHLVTGAGREFPPAAWNDFVEQEQMPHSTALHARLLGLRYLTGPLARYSLNQAKLSPLAREAARAGGLGERCVNPFQSIVVRAVEMVYAIDEALRIVRRYEPPARPAVEVPPRAGVGHGVTEAPRGILYHRYAIGDDGLIRQAQIVSPTSQIQPAIEEDLRLLAGGWLHLDDAALTAECERAIRNYDPCISCSAHFLNLRRERR